MSSYEVRVVGMLGPAAKEAFTGLSVVTEPAATVLRGDMDQAELHETLERVRSLGLQLLDISRRPDIARRPDPAAGS